MQPRQEPQQVQQVHEWIDDLYCQFVGKQDDWAKGQGAINHDIYEKRLTAANPGDWPDFQLTPHSMYFYYVRINADGRLVIDHYFYVDGDVEDNKTWKEIPYSEKGLCKLVTKLAINARPIRRPRPGQAPRERKPPCLGKGNIKKTLWCHKSYVAIFFDEANWSLRKKPTDGSESAVAFIVKEGNKVGVPNHSFFDAIDLDIEMPLSRPAKGGSETDDRTAIVFVNHMKGDDKGNDLGNCVQEFTFKMIVDVKAEMPEDPPTVFIIDPGGTNDGPPLPPPPAD